MRNKNWIEFNNEEEKNYCESNKNVFESSTKIIINKQKRGKKGKTITIIKGLNLSDKVVGKEIIRKLKIFCGTGGKLTNQNIELQGDMIQKVKEFLIKDGYQI